ncbi:MAG: MarR family winged helix-turn-helix transcriptional regulator [Streptosporangiaceae bacterium]
MHPTAELSRRMGYELKRAQAALRAAMDTTLRRHGLTVPQYACLELLDQCPGLSNSELARGAFVTRQSMNVVLRGLQDSGLVTRPPQAPHGRALPARLTAAGQHRLAAARATIIAIEQRMTAALPPQRAARLLADLGRMAQALEPPQRTPQSSRRLS